MEIRWKQNKAAWYKFSLGMAQARIYEVVKPVTDLTQYILKRIRMEQMHPHVILADLGRMV